MKALVQGSTHKIGSESQMPLEGPRCADFVAEVI